MASTSITWAPIALTILGGFASAGVLIIVWIGWLRTRRLAYLVLAAWALAGLFGLALGSVLLPVLQTRLGVQSISLTMGILFVQSVVTSVLLLLGLGMLVFGERKADASGER